MDPDDTFRKIEQQARRREQFERAAFIPSRAIERLVIQVLGAWTQLIGEVDWVYFHQLGSQPPEDDKQPKKLGATMRTIAERYDIRWPHNEWSTAAEQYGKVRHRLAHLLYVEEVEGTKPDQTLSFARLGRPEEGRSGNKATGLEWRDDVWSTQWRHTDKVTAAELREALAGIEWLLECVRYLGAVGELIKQEDLGLQVKLPWQGAWDVPWWFPEWGSRGTARLTVGDLKRRTPSLEEGTA